MSTSSTSQRASYISAKQILKRLCSSTLNPIVVFRRRRADTRDRPDEECNISSRRRVLHWQTSIVAMDVAVSIAETIPVFGSTLKGSLEALWKVLTLVEQRYRNADDVARLTERLTTLMEALGRIDAPGDRTLLRLLQGLHSVEDQLYRVLSKQGIRSQAVAKILADCGAEINGCLQDFMAVTLASMQIVKSEMVATECVTVFDPFGAPQKMLRVDMGAGNAEIVALMILNRYAYNPTMQQALKEYVDNGNYELTMDDGRRIQALNGALDSVVDRGTTVTMNVIVLAQARRGEDILCPVCQGPLPISRGRRTVCSTCDRRVNAMDKIQYHKYPKTRSDTARLLAILFRHITVRQRAKVTWSRAEYYIERRY